MKTVLVALPLLTSCATLFDGGPNVVTVETNPPGATVWVDGENAGTTPCDVPLWRSRHDTTMRITAPGRETAVVEFESEFNFVFLVNLFFPGLPGMAVDFATGNMWEYRDDLPPIELPEGEGEFVVGRPPEEPERAAHPHEHGRTVHRGHW